MTKDEALKLALEYVELVPDDRYNAEHIDREALVTAIREALAQPEHGWTPERIAGMARLKDAQDKKLAQPEQEPVGQLLENAFGRGQVMWFNKPKDESMLYTTPPQRTWVGLTDDEIQKCWKAAIKLNSEKGNDITNQTFYHLVKIVEEELMEKNYG